MPQPDHELVRESMTGNVEAFRKLVERYQNPVFSLAFRLTGNREEAEDMAQETFLNIYKNLNKFKSDLKFSSWLFRIASNVCISHLRRRKGATLLELQEETLQFHPLTSNNPADLFEVKERHELIRLAVRQLPPKYQLVLLLKYMNDLSYQEIADALQISVHNVEMLLYRGRKMLALMLASDFPEKRCSK